MLTKAQEIGLANAPIMPCIPATDVERATWTRAIAKLADPKLYVETGAQ